jgi:hypothetical protein
LRSGIGGSFHAANRVSANAEGFMLSINGIDASVNPNNPVIDTAATRYFLVFFIFKVNVRKRRNN